MSESGNINFRSMTPSDCLKYLFFTCCLCVSAFAATDKSQASDVVVGCLKHRIDSILTQSSSGNPFFFFVEADDEIRMQISHQIKSPRLKSKEDFFLDRYRNYRLKVDNRSSGCSFSVDHIEVKETSATCVLYQHFGPLGALALQYFLEQKNGGWVVVKVTTIFRS